MNKLLKKLAGFMLGVTLTVGVGVGIEPNSYVAQATNALNFHFAGSSLITSESYSSYSDSVSSETKSTITASANWQITVGNNSAQLGTNAKAGNLSKLVLGNGSFSAASGIASALSIATTTQKYAAAICTTAISNINSIELIYSGTNGGKPNNIYALSSTDGTTWTVEATLGNSKISSGCLLDFEVNATASQYAFVADWTTLKNGGGFKGFQLKLYSPSGPQLESLALTEGTGVVKKYFEGDVFNTTGLVVTGTYSDSSEEVITEGIDWTINPSVLSSSTTSVEVTAKVGTVTSNKLTITGISVASFDFELSYAKSPFDATSAPTSDTIHNKTVDGIQYQDVYGYNYASSSVLSFNKNYNSAYLGNVTAYSKDIARIVITLTTAVSSKFTVYEGAVSLAETTAITPTLSNNNLTATYDFSDTVQYFKLRLTSIGTYVNITSIKIYLGTTHVARTASSVAIDTPTSLYVGKQQQLNATVTYTVGASDNNVTWSVVSGTGVTVTDAGLATAIGTEATVIKASSAEDTATPGVKATATVTITPLANNLTGVEFDTSNAKKVYYLGDSLDISNITATGTYTCGDTLPITLTSNNFTGFNSSVAVDSQIITITVESFTTTYTIKVLNQKMFLLNSDKLGSFGYDDYKYPEFNTNLNSNLTSVVKLEGHGLYKNSGIQINTGKGSYIKNTTSLPGKIEKIEIEWKASGKNSPTLYFGASYFEDVPEEGGVELDNSVTSHSIVPTSDSYYFFLDGDTVSGACVMLSFKIYVLGVSSTEGEARNYADNFLHMNDYDEELGYCKDSEHHYYSDAKAAYGKLTSAQKAEFAKLSNATARLAAWATANGETFDVENNTIVSTARFEIVNNNSALMIVMISIMAIASISFTVVIISKKRKHSCK